MKKKKIAILIEVNRDHENFDCRNCVNGHHCTEIAEDARWPQSVGVAPIDMFEIPNVIKTNVYLRPMITQASLFYFRLYKHYQKSMFPYSGGLLDQPAVYMQAMELIESLQGQ